VKKGPEKRVGDLLPSVLRGLGLEGRFEEGRLRAEWKRVVGEAIAERSRPLRVRGKTLLVAPERDSSKGERRISEAEDR
jgi:predicted nucleic acid-binding Zn ribbon protein